MVDPDFESILFNMPVGAVSDVVETKLGFHLVKNIEHREGAEASFTEAEISVRDFLRHARRGDAIKAYVEELKAKAKIEIDPERPLVKSL